MKQSLLFLTFLVLPFYINAQIVVVEKKNKIELVGGIQPIKRHKVELTRFEKTYCLNYIDTKHKSNYEYKSFCFDDLEGSFDDFYGTILNGFDELPEDPVKISFPNCNVEFKFSSSLGTSYVEFFHYFNGNVGTSVQISRGKWEKLFGMDRI
ncbi:hypothetical protein [Aquimarina agarilytica]|uniref:hypothetical protein n=1 Tax=Aquimarina agarilytica TaxID=1087449 RepID=UPI0002894F6E|nr:hypothetical protein [Aquimarina agarilytica]